MPIDPEAAALIELLDQFFPRVDEVDDAVKAREMMRSLPPVPGADDVASVEDRTIPGGVPVRIYRPATDAGASDESTPGVVYFHGGGWVLCNLDSHDGMCRRVANELSAVVVSVDYRLAPEHKFPAAIEDAYAALVWLADHADVLGVDPTRLVVAGDSAGGNLAAVVAQMSRDRGGPALAFQLLVYPVIDSSPARNDWPSRSENAVGYFLTLAQIEWYRNQYLPDDDAGEDPLASPHLAASLSDLPPACVVTAEMDLLRDEGEHYGHALEAAGVAVTIYRAPGMFHGFFNMDAALGGAKDAQRAAFAAARAVLHDEER